MGEEVAYVVGLLVLLVTEGVNAGGCAVSEGVGAVLGGT